MDRKDFILSMDVNMRPFDTFLAMFDALDYDNTMVKSCIGKENVLRKV